MSYNMALRKKNSLLNMANSYVLDSPQPSNLNYFWNFGSLLALCLVIQLATGITLAMHYTSHASLAFDSVEHIMRDVNFGWFIRYAHANTASFFFICIYAHMGRNIYYGSYKTPRVLPWSIGVIIFLLLIITAFMGYVLVFGQMSLWGKYIASNVFILMLILNVNLLYIIYDIIYNTILNLFKLYIKKSTNNLILNHKPILYRKDVTNYIGPLNSDIISIIYGTLLGDGNAEKRTVVGGTRINIYQEGSHKSYLLYLHSLFANLGYCNTKIPNITTRLGNKGKIRKIIRFSTWSYHSFNFIYQAWYIKTNKGFIKILPKNIEYFLNPLSMAIWIMDDGRKVGEGLKIATNNFTSEEVDILVSIITRKFNLKCVKQSSGSKNQYIIYFWKESIPDLWNLVKDHIEPSMKYKFGDVISNI